MKSNRKLLAGTALAAGALLTAAAGGAIAAAADEAATATPAAPATPATPGPHAWHRHGAGYPLSKLGLSAEQQAAVKACMENAVPQMASIRREMRANSLRLRQTQPNDPNYAGVVAQVAKANGALHAQMITQRAAMRARIFDLLTPAQQTRLAALQAQMQARMQARGAGTPPAAQ